jgi:branched-chain amino acid transport system permease protein
MGALGQRRLAALALLVVVLLALPLFADQYVISVLVVFLLAAYLGQTWNIMMGFAGQLSLGHALFYGLGAYVAAALYAHWAVLPWFGMLAGAAVAGLVGAAIAALSFRFGVAGVYFALLTIAFNEFTHILFNHFAWVGGSAGLFLPVATLTQNDLVHLRGSPTMFYYLLLALSLGALALSHVLLRRRIGYYWQAIREDQQAAQSLGIDVFRYKLLAMTVSAVLTAVAGALMAFYDNNLYPDTIFTTARSVEIITAPIIGGIGTLMGPIVGAFVLTVLGEAMTSVNATLGIAGLKQWCYGGALVLIVLVQPSGLWPWLKRALRLDSR